MDVTKHQPVLRSLDSAKEKNSKASASFEVSQASAHVTVSAALSFSIMWQGEIHSLKLLVAAAMNQVLVPSYLSFSVFPQRQKTAPCLLRI